MLLCLQRKWHWFTVSAVTYLRQPAELGFHVICEQHEKIQLSLLSVITPLDNSSTASEAFVATKHDEAIPGRK